MIKIDKVKGVLYGQAIGDALGLGTEFMNDAEMAKCYPHGLRHFRCSRPTSWEMEKRRMDR